MAAFSPPRDRSGVDRAYLLVPKFTPWDRLSATMVKPPSSGRPGSLGGEPTLHRGSSKSLSTWETLVSQSDPEGLSAAVPMRSVRFLLLRPGTVHVQLR